MKKMLGVDDCEPAKEPSTFTREGAVTQQQMTVERSTFERQADDVFKMTYKTSSHGKTWRLGDYVVFRKKL